MILLELSDFDVYYQIAQSNDTKPVLQEYIDRYEKSYIMRLLGVELGQKFIDDIQGVDSDSSAIEDRFLEILNPFIKQQDNDGDVIYESKGMKALLAGLVFYHYVIDGQLKHSQSGVMLNQAEVSSVASPYETAMFAENKWNESLSSVYAVQWFCGTEDEKTYPEYAGTYFKVKYSNLL